jgi:hypothetical protein
MKKGTLFSYRIDKGYETSTERILCWISHDILQTEKFGSFSPSISEELFL